MVFLLKKCVKVNIMNPREREKNRVKPRNCLALIFLKPPCTRSFSVLFTMNFGKSDDSCR